MAVGDVWKLVVMFTQAGQLIRPGLHFSSNVEVQGGQALIDSWQATVQVPMLAAMSNETTLTGYQAQDKKPGLDATIEELLPTPAPGTLVEPALPPQDAVVVSLQTALKSRRSRGRTYWPGATEAQVATGALTSAAYTTWNAFVEAIRTSYVGATPPSGWTLVVYSPEELDPPKAPPVFKPRPGQVITPVTFALPRSTIRTQRRRQIGVGQ